MTTTLTTPALRWPDVTTIPGLSPHQREQAALALAGHVGILAGTPGTGKTYTLANIVRPLVDRVAESRNLPPGVYSPHNLVAVAAPTGKAAVRITESLQAYGLNVEATTIHRLLEVRRNGHDGKGWGFNYNRANTLPADFVFVDEMSMLDTDLAASLLDAIAPGTHVLFVGDPYQLPPVGHGAPLRDMIAAGLPYGELTEIHRNDGAIVRTCASLRVGDRYAPSNAPGSNVKHVECRRPADTLAALYDLLQTVPPHLDRIWDIQVLAPLNETSELARAKINKQLQAMLNPHGKTAGGHRFRVGDKVICTSNCWLPLLDEDGEKVTLGNMTVESPIAVALDPNARPRIELDVTANDVIKEFVANGEIGRVEMIDDKLMHVAFDSPKRSVLVPLGKGKEEEECEEGRDEGAATSKSKSSKQDGSGKSFDLAYCITTHKAQGSQAPVVVVLADDANGANFVCSREWWYTAISRAELQCFTVGRVGTINRHCKRVALGDRKTFLRELIDERKGA